MHYDIAFPNLGIYLEHVGKNIDIFGFTIAYYGIIIGCAILIGFLIATAEAKRTRQNPEDYLDMGIIGVIAGIAGARIYYVVFSWEALAILNGQMLGRWGNFFNREAFGDYTDGLFAMRLPVDAVRAGDITDTMREHMETIAGVDYIQVSPTFLYESVWCAVLLILLVLYRKHKKYEGEMFLLYIFGYALGRVWIEGLRTDQLLIPGIGFPVSQALAGCVVVFAGIALLYLRKNHKRMPLLKSEKVYENHKRMPLLKSEKVYEPMPDRIEGKKPPKKKDRIFKFKDK